MEHFSKYTAWNLRPLENERHNLMPLMAYFIAGHASIVLFQCHIAQCLASWGHGPLSLNPPLHFIAVILHLIFLPRDAMRKRGLRCRPVSVHLYVRPSVTLVDCMQTAEDIVKLLSRPGSPIILLSWLPAPVPNSTGNLFSGVGGKNLRFSTEIAVYLWNGTR